MITKFFDAVLVAVLITSFGANAAEEAAKEASVPKEQSVKAEPAKKKMKRHCRVEVKGDGAPAEGVEPKVQPKRPSQDHQHEH